MSTSRTHRVISRAAAIATAGLAAFTLTGQASAAPLEDAGPEYPWVEDTYYMEVPDCHTTTQFCSEVPSVGYWFYHPTVFLEFTANQNHCADMWAHFIVDGQPRFIYRVGPGQTVGDVVYQLTPFPGPHTIAIKAEGITGGCNTGYIGAWGGTLHVAEI